MVNKARAARRQQQQQGQQDGAPRDAATLPERHVDRLAARVAGCPPHVVYVPGFLEQDEAARLSAAIGKMEFVALNGRQLSNHGGVPSLAEGGTILEPLPAPLRALAERLRACGLFESAPDQALVNRYRAGEGIAAHSDGPNFKPQAAIVSLQSAVVLRFHSPAHEPAGSVLLEPGSLLFFSGDAFETHKHSIAATLEEDCADVANAHLLGDATALLRPVRRDARLSVTLRNVAKVRCVRCDGSPTGAPLLCRSQRITDRACAWHAAAVDRPGKRAH